MIAPVALVMPRQLAPYLIGHEVRTVRQERWDGLKNGNLLSAAEAAGFSIFVTGDRNLEHQQNHGKRNLGFIVLSAVSNRLEDLLPLVGGALEAIERVRAGQVIRVRA